MQASVKVMRSYDYCHFEVALSEECSSLDSVNELRKCAAILVDEAVRQYKVAKKKESSREYEGREKEQMLKRLEYIKSKPEFELTTDEMALLRYSADKEFWEKWNADDYFYQDEEKEYHFSMLNKFKDYTVKATAPTE